VLRRIDVVKKALIISGAVVYVWVAAVLYTRDVKARKAAASRRDV
jgi:hypothetical protein